MTEGHCFWMVAPSEEAAAAAARTVASASTVGVFQPFHVWTDIDVSGAE